MNASPTLPLAQELPPPLRLAVAYASRPARPLWTALLALDLRLAKAALGAGEPLLGQIRLAWWRDRFRDPAVAWPQGEPLLAALRPFDSERGALEGLIDGWEGLCGDEAEPGDIARLTEARAAAIAALARLANVPEQAGTISMMAHRWASADLAVRLERPVDPNPAASSRSEVVRLPRAMRPLTIMDDLALHSQDSHRLGTLLRIVRLGLLGR